MNDGKECADIASAEVTLHKKNEGYENKAQGEKDNVDTLRSAFDMMFRDSLSRLY